ncbi:MAG: hypothetical protein GY851_13455 [bacterium]|nr:hypothetical protein [bacterium]
MHNRRHLPRFMVLLGVGLALTAVLPVSAQTTATGGSFREFTPGAQIRDAVILPKAGLAYLAAYDLNQVWRVDLGTGETSATLDVGKGPVALAVSPDGKVLACANRLSGTVSLVDLDAFALIADVDSGQAPAGVASLPGGGFVVVSSFADRATLIDPTRPDNPVLLDAVKGVPNAVASSDTRLAVTVRVPASLLVFTGGSKAPAVTVPLPAAAVALTALPDDRFVVATAGRVLVVNGKDGSILAQRDVAALDVAVRHDEILLLTGEQIEVCSPALEVKEAMAVPAPGLSLATGNGLIAVLAPKSDSWRLHGDYEPVRPVVAKTDPAPAADKPAAQPVSEQPTKPGQAIPGQRPPGRQVASVPLGSRQPTAPKGQMRATPTPGDLDKSALETAGVQVGLVQGGFQPPDMTKPFRDLAADDLQFEDDGKRIIAKKNVRLTLDTVEFKSDELFYDETTGELHVSGNVVLAQADARAYADDIRYILPEGQRTDTPPPLSAQEDDVEQELARKMLSLGSLDAKNIEIIEPTRRLNADRIIYDFSNQTGQAYNVVGQAGDFYFGGERLDMLGPDYAEGENLWLTTCDPDHEYYKVRLKRGFVHEQGAVSGQGARLEIGNTKTPIYWPRWTFEGGENPTVGFDFDSGHSAELGYYVNVGQQFSVRPNVQLGYRFWPTTAEGLGVGFESKYDFMEHPESGPLFRSLGSFRSLYTTNSRGHVEWYHRHELDENTVVLAQVEQWFDADFYKDFYYDEYKNRSEPRTFVNVTHTKPTYIATGTIRQETNGFVAETERAPEVSYHLLERRLAKNLYVSFDTVDGYNEREPAGDHAVRSANVARLSYDLELAEVVNLTPFAEAEGTWYSHTREGGDSDVRFSAILGATAQSRYHKIYPGKFGFSAFKHLVVPSFTLSYRPSATMNVEDTPRFDVYDNVYGRTRWESKMDHLLFGRDAETGDSWQVARLTLYQGTDLWNELRSSRDYELELDIRPRAWWGFQFAGEHHSITDEGSIDDPFYLQNTVLETYERIVGEPYDPEVGYQYNARYGDYDRILTYLYYDDTPIDGKWNGRIGYAYTETQGRVFNREVIYGLGYKFNDIWSAAFEHRYDIERGDLYRQRYEVRRVFHCLEGAFLARERNSGWDFSVEFSVTGLPGTKLSF